jgi:hypothetical protein
LPDSVKAVSYLATVNVKAIFYKRVVATGIVVDNVNLKLVSDRKGKTIFDEIASGKTEVKIKLLIPSALAYSIITRSPKIPTKSALLFEIEVLDAQTYTSH